VAVSKATIPKCQAAHLELNYDPAFHAALHGIFKSPRVAADCNPEVLQSTPDCPRNNPIMANVEEGDIPYFEYEEVFKS